jgi:hypothetical protein
MEAAAGKPQLLGRLVGGQSVLAKGIQNVPDEGGGVTLEQLLVLFINRAYPVGAASAASLFVSLRYAPGFLKDWPLRQCHGRVPCSPVLLC